MRRRDARKLYNSIICKNRLYPRYSLNTSDNEDTPIHRSIYAQPYNSLQVATSVSQQQHSASGGSHQSQQQSSTTLGYNSYRTAGTVKNSSETARIPISGNPTAGPYPVQPTTTPSSDNGSSATLTDAEAALARENTLLVNNGLYSKKKLTPPFDCEHRPYIKNWDQLTEYKDNIKDPQSDQEQMDLVN
ncbi:uncharacterized protein LOC129743550 [Uranotaenia lowii]|uniref:uncharacterized protein LOC129743550 n=1 Tax=Uranotaenia lowii TaxID=190385 RepID=UPI002479C1D8|nr:uncharacterized protein LOC129743550 [Uranotaenia lowii]